MPFLLTCTCTQPERLQEALLPVASALIARGRCSQWGFGYVAGGEVLLSRTPSPAEDVDFFAAIAEVRTDYLIGTTDVDSALGGPDNTSPFRSRRWLFGHTGFRGAELLLPPLLAEIPAYLQRTIRGKSIAEVIFHIALSHLGARNRLEDQTTPAAELTAAVRHALERLRAAATAHGLETPVGNLALTNGRAVVCARTADPLFARHLSVNDDKGNRDRRFRGALALSAATAPAEGFEEIPSGSAFVIHRDLRTETLALGL